MNTCHCGATIPEGRVTCSRSCSARLAGIQRRAKVTADLEEAVFLLGFGLSPHEIATRLGTTVTALARAAQRHGAADVVRPFSTAENHNRRHPCQDCGAPGVWSGNTRCRPCENRNRTRSVAA